MGTIAGLREGAQNTISAGTRNAGSGVCCAIATIALMRLLKMHPIPPDEVHLKPDLLLK